MAHLLTHLCSLEITVLILQLTTVRNEKLFAGLFKFLFPIFRGQMCRPSIWSWSCSKLNVNLSSHYRHVRSHTLSRSIQYVVWQVPYPLSDCKWLDLIYNCRVPVLCAGSRIACAGSHITGAGSEFEVPGLQLKVPGLRPGKTRLKGSPALPLFSFYFSFILH